MENPSSGNRAEGADQGHRHGEQRDQGGAPALQEEKDHENDQNQRFDQGLLDFLHPFRDRQGGVEGHHVIETGRKAFLQRP